MDQKELSPTYAAIKAMLLEELAEAGIDLDEFPAQMRMQIVGTAMQEAIKTVVDMTRDSLEGPQRKQLETVLQEGDPGKIIVFLDEALPDFGVLDALRGALKIAYREVRGGGKLMELRQNYPDAWEQGELMAKALLLAVDADAVERLRAAPANQVEEFVKQMVQQAAAKYQEAISAVQGKPVEQDQVLALATAMGINVREGLSVLLR